MEVRTTTFSPAGMWTWGGFCSDIIIISPYQAVKLGKFGSAKKRYPGWCKGMIVRAVLDERIERQTHPTSQLELKTLDLGHPGRRCARNFTTPKFRCTRAWGAFAYFALVVHGTLLGIYVLQQAMHPAMNIKI